jgi:hypothetical protein
MNKIKNPDPEPGDRFERWTVIEVKRWTALCRKPLCLMCQMQLDEVCNDA